MSRYSLSNEADILNHLDHMNESLYKGLVFKEDTEYAIKTIRNLMLELYLVNQKLDSREKTELDEELQIALAASENFTLTSESFESNKPF